MTYHSDWSKVSTKEKVSSSLHCLWMLVMKHFNTHNVRPRNILEPLTPKTKPSHNWFYMNCVKWYLLCANRWLSNVLIRHVREWKHRKYSPWACPFSGVNFSWRFSLSKNISPAAPDLKLTLFPLWYWPIMNAHTKQQQDEVFETFYWQSKIWPPICAPFGTKSLIIYI